MARRPIGADELLDGEAAPPPDASLEGAELVRAFWRVRGRAVDQKRAEAYWAATSDAVADAYRALEQRTAELHQAREELERLNQELESRVRAQVAEILESAAEVEGLNAQLRMQVQERSRQLLAALHRAASAALLEPGTDVGGRSKVLRFIGRGGMGEVYLAHDVVIGRKVALKLMRPDLYTTPDQLRRFITEAAAAAAVSDPGVVRTFHLDVGDDGRLYLIMELVEGRTLARALYGGPLAVPICLRLGEVVARTLAATHAAGVVHRDIKPSNLILTRAAPGVRVLDFGLSRMRDAEWRDGANATRASFLLGTPAYMAPEQIRDPTAVSNRCDVYSLGIVLYQAATGRLPYERFSGSILNAHLEALPEDAPELPGAIAGTFLRCLAKDPEDRPTAAELSSELALLAGQLGAAPAEELIGEVVGTERIGGSEETEVGRGGDF